MPTSDESRRCLFFGAGRWGRNVIDSFVSCGAVPSGFLVKGSDTTRDWLATHFPEVPVFSDPERLLTADDASTVVIATPKETHVELAELALGHGRHVFVEKPMALEPSDGERLASLAQDRGLALFTGFVYLYHPAFARLHAAVRSEEISSLRFTWNRPALVGPVEWELLPHELALAITLTGETPTEIAIVGGGGRALCQWTLANGATVHIELSGCGPGPKEKRLRLVTGGGDKWDWLDHRLLKLQNSSTSIQATDLDLQFSPTEPLVREVQWFLDHRTDRRAMSTDMALSVSVTDLINRALTKRQEQFA